MKKNMGGLANDDLNAISKRVKLKGDILATMTKNKSNPPQNLTKRKDYSAYRTPSGNQEVNIFKHCMPNIFVQANTIVLPAMCH